MRDHAAAEAVLRDCGVPFTSLRNGFYATSAVMLLGDALQTGELITPEDGPVAWTTHADLADAAALARGLPEAAADMLVGLFAASRQGEFEPADPTLARLLRRPAEPFAELLRATAGS